MNNDQPVVVVLAAGQGAPSSDSAHLLAQPLGHRTVLGQTLSHVLLSGLPTVVVTTPALAAEAGRTVAQRDIVTVSPADIQRGAGGAVALGVSARAGAAGWLLLPGDMAQVSPASLLAVARALPGHAIVVPHHQGLAGHPLGFSAELFGELMVLHGDDGLRRLLRRFPQHALDLPDPGIRAAISTLHDLESARERARRSASAVVEPPG